MNKKNAHNMHDAESALLTDLVNAKTPADRMEVLKEINQVRRTKREKQKAKRLQECKKDMTLSEMLSEGRRIWGTPKLAPTHIVTCMGVVFGDIARCVRDIPHDEHAMENLKKEMGNMILSTIRWADDLRMDVTEVVGLAVMAQEEKAKQRPMSDATLPDWGPYYDKCAVTVCEQCGKAYASDIGHVSGREICEKCGPRHLSEE